MGWSPFVIIFVVSLALLGISGYIIHFHINQNLYNMKFGTIKNVSTECSSFAKCHETYPKISVYFVMQYLGFLISFVMRRG